MNPTPSKTLAAVAITTLGVASPGRAATIIHESFGGYTTGASIIGQAASGTGLAGNWAADTQATTGNSSTATAIASGLTFSNLATSGGAVRLSSSSGAASGTNYVVLGAATSASLGTVSGNVWVSYLVRAESFTASGQSINQRINTSATGLSASSRFAVNPDAGLTQTTPGVDYIGNTTTNGGTVPTLNTTFLMLGKFNNVNVAGSQTASMWFMSAAQYDDWQLAGGTEALLNSRAQGTGTTQLFSKQTNTDTANGTNNAFVGGTGTNVQFSINAGTVLSSNTIVFDELRYGNGLVDVIVIPEPSVASLGLLGALGLLRRRR